MAKAFPEAGKGFPKALEDLRAAVQGGGVLDSVDRVSGASPIVLESLVYKHLITSGGTGTEVVQLPVPAEVGSRILVDFVVEGDASDVVRINGDGTATIESGGIVGDTPSAITNVDLDTPGEYALFEYEGGDVWNLLYTDGATS